MLPTHQAPPHPGEILLEEFLEPLGITQTALAEHLGIPTQRVNEIVRGKRGISPETAWLLSAALETTPGFWMHLQMQYDLYCNRPSTRKGSLLRAESTRI
ncbi:MAG: HigA family addiction module antitoxin [Cyanobacteria bacterium P01_G01_bin.54]